MRVLSPPLAPPLSIPTPPSGRHTPFPWPRALRPSQGGNRSPSRLPISISHPLLEQMHPLWDRGEGPMEGVSETPTNPTTLPIQREKDPIERAANPIPGNRPKQTIWKEIDREKKVWKRTHDGPQSEWGRNPKGSFPIPWRRDRIRRIEIQRRKQIREPTSSSLWP